MDLIDRHVTIDALEETDWYHQNRSGEMVHGANSDEDRAWYKAEDVYGVLERMPSVQPETDLQSTCNEVATDCISRQKTADAIGKRAESYVERFGTDGPFWEGLVIAKNIVECAPSAQPETAKRIVGKSKDGMTLWYQCDMCNEPVDAQDNFCRGCGRRLTDG